VVVAGIPGDEATIKTFSQSNGEVTLTPANATMQPLHYSSAEVAIYGKVVSVLRKL
jgi:repressor LexA